MIKVNKTFIKSPGEVFEGKLDYSKQKLLKGSNEFLLRNKVFELEKDNFTDEELT